LFDAKLPVLSQLTISPNARRLLIDLDRLEKKNVPRVIAASCRVTHEQATADSLTFDADGIAETDAVVRIETLRKPSHVLVGGVALGTKDFETSRDTLLVHFPNVASSTRIEVRFAP
jgi:hypothetical protein